MMLVIRNPEITKKTSTPTNPPRQRLRESVKMQDQHHSDGADAIDIRPILLRRRGQQRTSQCLDE